MVNRLGTTIKKLRRKKGIRQCDLAERVGITLNFLSLVENGHRSLSRKSLSRVAKALDVPAAALQWYSLEPPPGLSQRDAKFYKQVDELAAVLMGE